MVGNQSLEQRDRARRAVELKISGKSWAEVAKETGYDTESGPRQLVTTYFAAQAKDQFAHMHPLLVERAERLWSNVCTKLDSFDDQTPVETWDRVMRQAVSVLTTIARLHGVLDGPKIEVNINTEPLTRLRDEFLALRAAPPPTIIDPDDD